MNYFWVLENIDSADIEDLRQALKDLKTENERLLRVVKVRDMALKSKLDHELLTGSWLV